MPRSTKAKAIYTWKRSGLKHDNYNALYDDYIRTTHCQHCGNEFKGSRDRCMEHDHKTALFRLFLCRWCNTRDIYIKCPKLEDRPHYVREQSRLREKRMREERHAMSAEDKPKLTLKEIVNMKYTCVCGGLYAYKNKYRHLKTKKHLKWVSTNQNV